MEKNLFDIKLEVIKLENPKLENHIDKYQVAKDLYIKGEYEKAIDQARNTFQVDLEENFNLQINTLDKSKFGTIEYYCNEILKNISEMRHKYFKATDKSQNKNLQAIAKLAIEQIINIRNYLEMVQA